MAETGGLPGTASDGIQINDLLGKILSNPEILSIFGSLLGAKSASAATASTVATAAKSATDDIPVSEDGADSDAEIPGDGGGTAIPTPPVPAPTDAADKSGATAPPAINTFELLGKLPELGAVFSSLGINPSAGNILSAKGGNSPADAAERKKQNDRRCALLSALKPYLSSPKRTEALDGLIGISRLFSLLGF